jgi:cyclophilin family peptidyl-prolyl cis-trans isomerase
MRLRLLLLPAALLAAALLVPSTEAASSAGCSSTKPAAAGKTKPSFKKPASVRIVLDRNLGGPIPNAIAFLVQKHFFDGLTFHRVVADFVLQGGDPRGDGTGGPGFEVVGPLPRSYRYKLGDIAMAKTLNAPSGASGSQFFVISGSGGTQLPPDYGLLGHAADRASLATIARIAALATTACPGGQDCPPSKKVWIVTARLVTLP